MNASMFPATDCYFRRAHLDFIAGLKAWRLWFGLGLRDIQIRYQRTWLGPLWITLSTAAAFTSLGMLYSAVMKNDVTVFLPYLAAGLVTWNLFSAVTSEAPRIFVDTHHIVTSLRLPLIVHVLRGMVRNGLIFLHNIMAALAALLIMGGSLTPAHLLLFLTLPVVMVALCSGALILGMLGARFRDLEPAVGMALQLVFFMTPIIWHPDVIPLGRKWWIDVNPVFHLLEIVRSPLLGTIPNATSVVIACATAASLAVAAYLLFGALRRRIPFWL